MTHGESRGPVAGDGSPVEVYLRIPHQGEADAVHEMVEPGSQVLELGCGVGRVTHPLLALGHSVVAVDSCQDMLAHVRGAETVLADIEALDLGRRFQAVLLASHLVNTGDDQARRRLLTSCARHVDTGGVVVIQRYPPDYEPAFSGRVGAVGVSQEVLSRCGSRFSARVTYQVDNQSWRQEFLGQILDDTELAAELEAVGLRLMRTLGRGQSWAQAVPA